MRIFRHYVPDDAVQGIQYLRDRDGVDWYEAQREFEAAALVVCTDETGRVCSADVDPSRLFPIDQGVWGVAEADVPKGFSVEGDWAIETGRLVPRRQTELDVQTQMRELLALALMDYQALQVLVDSGVATGKDIRQHEALRAYCQALYRVNQQKGYPAEVVWPEIP